MKPPLPAPMVSASPFPHPRHRTVRNPESLPNPLPMILPNGDGAPIYIPADQVAPAKLDSTWAEIKAQFLDLSAARIAGIGQEARSAALRLRTAADLYVHLCNQLQHSDQ